ncbi:MAG: DUF222 domain-containing protein, partial [Knoellia sp.]
MHVATRRIENAISQLTRTPKVVDAMATGDLDEQRASVVTEETDYLCPESATEVVDQVSEVWGELTTGPLRRFLTRVAAQVDPEAVAEQAANERERRGLTRRTGTHGTDHWRGDFEVEHARGAWAAVTERARQLVRDKLADNLAMARADAMMELLLEHCDVQVVVHTTRAAEPDTHTANTPNADTQNAETQGTADAHNSSPAAPPHQDAAPPHQPAPNAPRRAGTPSAAKEPAPTAAATTAAAADRAGAGELVEVGGLGTGGTTFVPRDWLDDAGTSDPARDLICDT